MTPPAISQASRDILRAPKILRYGIYQSHRVLADAIGGNKAERRPRTGKERLAATQHHGMEVEPILINKTKIALIPGTLYLIVSCVIPSVSSSGRSPKPFVRVFRCRSRPFATQIGRRTTLSPGRLATDRRAAGPAGCAGPQPTTQGRTQTPGGWRVPERQWAAHPAPPNRPKIRPRRR